MFFTGLTGIVLLIATEKFTNLVYFGHHMLQSEGMDTDSNIEMRGG